MSEGTAIVLFLMAFFSIVSIAACISSGLKLSRILDNKSKKEKEKAGERPEPSPAPPRKNGYQPLGTAKPNNPPRKQNKSGEKIKETCEHLTKSGCSIVCLHCKLWLCDEAEKELTKKSKKKYKRLREIANKNNLLKFREPK